MKAAYNFQLGSSSQRAGTVRASRCLNDPPSFVYTHIHWFPGTGATKIFTLQIHYLGVVRANKKSPICDDLIYDFNEVLEGDIQSYKKWILKFNQIDGSVWRYRKINFKSLQALSTGYVKL